jgi:N-acetylglucosaminyl-diphospho-decaprenol L-rhamnosyltransferase
MARPAIIIVAYHAGENVRRCVEAVQVDASDATVYLVDNESYPHQLEPILRDFPTIVGIPLAKNVGFGAAANRGIQRAFDEGATHALLLNDDVYLRGGCVAALVEAAGEGGAASPWLAGDGDAAYRGGKIDWQKGYAGHQEGATDYLIGGCMMISRQAWERTGWFDESFFLYCEDVDWCLRARAAGVPLVVVPRELADHDGGASTGAGQSATWGYWWSRNRLRLARKHGEGSITRIALRQVVSASRQIAVAPRNPTVGVARMRGVWAGIRTRT